MGRFLPNPGELLVFRALTFALVLVVAGCDWGTHVLLVDPHVDLSAWDGGFKIEGDPHVEMGFYIEQLYQPLGEGEPCCLPSLQGRLART